jgi:hypothetical protein
LHDCSVRGEAEKFVQFPSEALCRLHVVNLDFNGYLAGNHVETTSEPQHGGQFREALVLGPQRDRDQFVFN